jgi:hypothetical protein
LAKEMYEAVNRQLDRAKKLRPGLINQTDEEREAGSSSSGHRRRPQRPTPTGGSRPNPKIVRA